MGYSARANPRSFDGKAGLERDVMMARLTRFAAFFATREQYEAYLETAGVTDTERGFLETVLPYALRARVIV